MNVLPLPLLLGRYAARRVLLPGDNFPIRAIEPEIMVAEHAAQGVAVSADRHSIRGYLRQLPADGSTIRVLYGDSQEGELRSAFRVETVQPLTTRC